jgi:RNA polymerase sigma factor (sigma-70 family)
VPRNTIPAGMTGDFFPGSPPRDAVAGAFASYRDRLKNFIRRRVPSAEDAEDILQEIFYQLARMNDLANPVEQTAAWLYRAARNATINLWRKKKDLPYPVDYDENGGAFLRDFADLLFDAEVTPETEYLRSLIWEELEAALAELPAEQRDIFEQTELLGIPVRDISEITRVPVNTLLSRKHYAVVKLRKKLQPLYDEFMGGSG